MDASDQMLIVNRHDLTKRGLSKTSNDIQLHDLKIPTRLIYEYAVIMYVEEGCVGKILKNRYGKQDI